MKLTLLKSPLQLKKPSGSGPEIDRSTIYHFPTLVLTSSGSKGLERNRSISALKRHP